MDAAGVIDIVQRVTATRADTTADRPTVETALRGVTALRSWLSAAEAELARQLSTLVPCPEMTLADTSRESTGKATRTIERAETLDAAPDLATALDDGAVTAAHIDTITRASKTLTPEQRQALIDRCDSLVDVATAATVDQWSKRVRLEARKLQTDHGMARLEQQRRATTLSTWVDDDGMWNLRGRFDPVTGVRLASRLEHTVEALFAEQTPDTCPSDPIAKQRHLHALALARLIEHGGTSATPGRAEFVVVIDTTNDTTDQRAAGQHPASHHLAGQQPVGQPPHGDSPDTTGPPWDVTWPIPVEIPAQVLHDLMNEPAAKVHPVIVRNGVILHAPGELNLGRSTRLANRAQRRALRGIYKTCAIPGCTVGYDHCKLHHITWWRHGGRTDLQNLLPVCARHHTKIHHDGWNVSLGPNRELTVTLPDGTTMATGPPHRNAA